MIFEVKNGSFGWTAENQVFCDVNFRIEEGEVLAILGPNGIGKTTLLRAALGFLKWTRGGSYIDGKNIEDMKPKDIWKGLAYVPQAKYPNFALTAIEMVVLGRNPHLKLLASPKEEDYHMAESVLNELGISKLRDVPVNRMSGGELQMVLIARALVSQPSLLILDEPESNLDFANQLKILNTIKTLALEHKISCMFNTHYPQHAFRIADRALLLGEGCKSLFGRVEDVLTTEHVRSFFKVESKLQEVVDGDDKWMTITPLHLT